MELLGNYGAQVWNAAIDMEPEGLWLLIGAVVVPIAITALVVLRIGFSWGYRRRVNDERSASDGGSGLLAKFEKLQRDIEKLMQLVAALSPASPKGPGLSIQDGEFKMTLC